VIISNERFVGDGVPWLTLEGGATRISHRLARNAHQIMKLG